MRLTLLSLGLAIAAVVFLLVCPVYSGFDGTRPTRATRLAVVLGGFALISGFSIGLFYVPATAAMVVAGSVRRSGCAIG